jgi:hypothetical protein
VSQAKNASNATPTDLSKDEISLLRTLKELGLPASRLTKLLSPKEEPPPVKGEEFDLVEVYHRAYSKALAIALERQALKDAGLLTQEEERPHNDNMNSLNAIVEALKSRPQSEKLSVSDLTMLILASNLGGGNKAEGGISLRDLLPLLQKGGQLSVSDVVALLERAKPPPPSAPPVPQSNSGLGDIFDESIKTVLRDKIVKALTEETKKGPPVDWAGVAGKVVEAIQSVTQRIPSAMAPPPEQVSAEVLPPPSAVSGSESPSQAVAAAASPPASETTTASPSTTSSSTPTQDLGGIEG